jgi:hypothetical protein
MENAKHNSKTAASLLLVQPQLLPYAAERIRIIKLSITVLLVFFETIFIFRLYSFLPHQLSFNFCCKLVGSFYSPPPPRPCAAMKGGIVLLLFSACCLTRVGALDQFREGFVNTVLPGSVGDTRDFPPFPYSTDTNRLADGVTSAAISTVTSPSFPLYDGSLSNVTDRLDRHLKYIRSAADQGIAEFGGGDAERENAKDKILQIPGYQNITKPTTTFPVYAAIKWNPSNFAIQDGETYRIDVLGSHVGFGAQFWSDGGIRVDPNGYDSYYDAISNCYVAVGRCRPYLKNRRRLVEANWMALSCGIGQFVRPLHQVESGEEGASRYLPLDEASLQDSLFVVGVSLEFRATYSGQLICFANDAQTQYWNNKGQLEVTVTRVSWPPLSDIYYKPLYDPACDAAYSVYKHGGDEAKKILIGCNDNGGGSGWLEKDVLNTETRYTSGMPDDYVATHT